MIFNRITGTYPIFFHAPGNKNNPERYWDINKIWGRIQHLRGEKQPKQKTKILTCNNSHKGVFEQSLDTLGYKYKVLSNNPWINYIKIDLFLEELRRTTEQYVIGADSFDVICVGNIDEAIEKYASSKMLISAEKNFFPPIEPLNNYKYLEESQAVNKTWKYLNSGIWMGPTEICLEFFELCKKLHNSRPAYNDYAADRSDQLIFHLAYEKMQQKVQLDYDCNVFQTVTFCNYETLWVKSFWL